MANATSKYESRSYSEKRNFHRMTLNTDIEVEMIDSHEIYPAFCLNLSGAGLMFRVQEELSEGALCRTTIKSGSEQTADLTATLKIIRCAPNGPAGFVVGAEIIEFN